MITFEDVYFGHRAEFCKEFLFTVLSQRKTWQNISHKTMPTWKDHVQFVDSKPYKNWYIIRANNKPVGSIYLTKDNEIGLFMLENWRGMGYGIATLNELFRLKNKVKEFKANISPKNSHSIAFFANQGFKYHSQLLDENKQNIIQYTYTKINPFYVE